MLIRILKIVCVIFTLVNSFSYINSNESLRNIQDNILEEDIKEKPLYHKVLAYQWVKNNLEEAESLLDSDEPGWWQYCKEDDPHYIFYNRIIKTGSVTLKNYMLRGVKGHKRRAIDNLNYTQEIAYGSEKRVVTNITKDMKKSDYTLYVRHTFWLDFEKYEDNIKPVYLQQLRNPVSRWISTYNQWWGEIKPGKRRITNEYKEELEKLGSITSLQCMEGNNAYMHKGCPSPNHQTRYMCGHDSICIDKPMSYKALEKAKMNMVNSYKFVGILEEVAYTQLLLGDTFPNWFSGVRMRKKKRRTNLGSAKYFIHDKEKIRQLNALDEELYWFGYALFLEKKWACGVRNDFAWRKDYPEY